MDFSFLTSTRRDRTQRALGLFVVALFVFVQAYAAMHYFVVEHHLCPVDGQLAHGEHQHAGDVDEHHEEEHSSGPLVQADEDSDEHGDDCSLPQTRDPRKTAPPRASWSAQQPRVWTHAAVLETQTFENAIAVFRLAPKQSPPLFA